MRECAGVSDRPSEPTGEIFLQIRKTVNYYRTAHGRPPQHRERDIPTDKENCKILPSNSPWTIVVPYVSTLACPIGRVGPAENIVGSHII